MDEDDFVWEFVFILFSVLLSFSMNNAFIIGIFKPGDIFSWAVLREPIDQRCLMSTCFYFVGLVIIVLGIAYFWKHKWLEKKNFYLKTLIAFVLGATPMFLYYIMFLVSKFVLGIPL